MIDFPFLRHMAAVLDGIPDDKLVLRDFYLGDGRNDHGTEGVVPDPHNCGTIACGFGWICLHPDANAKGVRMDKHGEFSVDEGLFSSDPDDASKRLFGLNYEIFWSLFTNRGHSEFDYGTEYSMGRSDKEVLRNRFVKFLDLRGQTSAQCIARGETP